jgi:hypothetical protein
MAHELRPLDESPVEKYFLLRDYSQYNKIVFKIPRSSEFPAPLQSHVEQIKQLAERLQEIYTEAETCSNATYCQGCLACLTGYLLLLCFDSHYEKKQKEAKSLLDVENEKNFRPHGIMIRNPCYNGLRCLEIEYYCHTWKGVIFQTVQELESRTINFYSATTHFAPSRDVISDHCWDWKRGCDWLTTNRIPGP